MKLVQRVLTTIAMAGVLSLSSIAQSTEPTQILELRLRDAPSAVKAKRGKVNATLTGNFMGFPYSCTGEMSRRDYKTFNPQAQRKNRVLLGYTQEYDDAPMLTQTVKVIGGKEYSFVGTCSEK